MVDKDYMCCQCKVSPFFVCIVELGQKQGRLPSPTLKTGCRYRATCRPIHESAQGGVHQAKQVSHTVFVACHALTQECQRERSDSLQLRRQIEDVGDFCHRSHESEAQSDRNQCARHAESERAAGDSVNENATRTSGADLL